jgi:hypothetical protein
MPIKSFRGILVDGDIDTIPLHTPDGRTGYRIVKFRLMGNEPGADNYESIVKIYTTKQSTTTPKIDFSENDMIGAGFFTGDTTQQTMKEDSIVFDNQVFNQDIYVTYNDLQGGDAKMNYYLELELIKLDLTEQTMATLQSIRSSSQGPGQKS